MSSGRSSYLKPNRGDLISILVTLLCCGALFFIDLTPPPLAPQGVKERARVLETDDSGIETVGLLKKGTQRLKVRVLSGRFKGKELRANNEIRAQMELDKVFQPGDTILVGFPPEVENPETITPNAQDFYRIHWTFLLVGLFVLFLLIYGGVTGLKAILSFVFSCLLIWKVMVPLCLKGVNPMVIGVFTVTFLSAVIIFLVAGINRKGMTAFFGAVAGVLVSCLMALIFTRLFRINGAVMPYSQALIYSGYENLSLADIFISGIFLSASGALMDLGMDIAAGMAEVVEHSPSISRSHLMMSGIRIGQSVVGTMTTTLLLAYSGGYLTLMMTFIAQGTLVVDFINNPYVASEVVKTIVGSFGLVLVAPLTALIGGFLLIPKREPNRKPNQEPNRG